MVGRLDYSNINFEFGNTDFGLSNLTLPSNIRLFTDVQTERLNADFQQFIEKSASGPANISATPAPTNIASLDAIDRIREQSDTRRLEGLIDRLNTAGIAPAIPTDLIYAGKVRVRPKSLPLLQSGDPKVIGYRPERYSWNKRDWWQVEAPGSTRPARFQYGEAPPNMLPVLSVDGIVVKIDFADVGGVRFDDWYLVSPATLKELQNESNPHYDISLNGVLGGIPLGETVPVISIDTQAIAQLISDSEDANRSAAIKDVIHIVEDPDNSITLPKTLVQQIDFTLKEGLNRPAAEWEQFDLNLNANYGIKAVTVANKQEDGSFDIKKMRAFLAATKDIQRGLQEDLNRIKRAYFRSDTAGFSTYKPYSEVANTTPTAPNGSFLEVVTDLTTVSNTLAPKPNTPVATLPEPEWAKSNESLVAKWDSLGLTPDDKLILTNPAPAGNRTYKIGRSLVNIAILWESGLCERIRVFDRLDTRPPTDWPPMREKLLQYFGALPDTDIFKDSVSKSDWDKYLAANDARKAEMLYMGLLIKELEATTGKIFIQPKGSPSPSSNTGASGATTGTNSLR